MAFRVLNVAEKNDAAKEIARVMSRGANSRREGVSRFNKIYEYHYNLFGRQCEMTMTSLSGHMMEIEFFPGYQAWHNCQPLALFSAPVQKRVNPDMDNIRKTLEKEVRKCHALIVWTDCDREGENIGFEVIEVCRKIKPRIDIYRARFSEITATSITRACANLARPDENTSFAVDVRQELDLRIGAAFTRFQTLRLQKLFPEVLSKQLISYGSCQFPTLGFVVQRYKDIVAFVAETFFKIKVKHNTPDGEAEFNWKRVRLFDRLACAVLHEECVENPMATVVNQITKPKSKWRPLPLDTVELEKLASRKLRINAKETMKIAEKLYNQGFISYPRTETNIFPSSLDLNNLIQQQTVDQNWGQFAANLLEEGANPRRGTKTDNAHPPIHPTKYTGTLNGNEKRLYEFIVRHFLACCSKDAQGVETVVEIDIAGEKFTAKGLTIIAKNYLNVYPYDKWCDKTLPIYQTGDRFMPTSIDMVEGATEPPSLLTEADLIALMEKHGIGTDATHAEHIEKIKARRYVGVQPDGKFVPGELGMGLVEGYDAMGFEMSKPHLRAELESDLKRICLGQKNKDVVLREQIEKYKEVFVQTCEHVNQLDEALAVYFGDPEELSEDPVASQVVHAEPVFACPSCQTQMCLKQTQDKGFMIGCMRYPDCTSRAFFPNFVLHAQVTERICPRCEPRPVYIIKFQFKRGSVPPMMELEYCACILCDENLREILSFRIKQHTASSGNQRNATRNNRGSQMTSRQPQQRQPRGRQRPAPGQKRPPPGQKRPPSGPQRPPRAPQRSSFDPGSNNQQLPIPKPDVCVVCSCNERAGLRTVRKEGVNKGREFYTCEKRECSFFLWADDAPDQNENGFSQATDRMPNSRKRPFQAVNETQNEMLCQCRQPAVLRTVRKDGPNQNRQFYCCSKPSGQQCRFFEWLDGDGGGQSFQQPARNVQNQRRQTYQQPGARNAQNQRAAPKRRCCGICRQPGHRRNNCPRK
ncbi:DNA topoisomerase 3-alpha-like [Dendronephthya gigantea]|uniref:DNA topoisomerase 3-alpha-like n=1 Tax=Dendronephthya gigantea TaxID=151771 RepID=UPI00106BEFD0|nr:DNA topoisomerase 3-alpha-like [Dendronephthya gigantea]